MERKRCICEVQEALRNISLAYKNLPLIASDGIFGQETKAAVKLFQRLKELNPTGEIDFATWQELMKENKRALGELKKPAQIVPIKEECLPLKDGDESGYVNVLKNMLSVAFKDYKKFNKNNIYDLETKEAVKLWQRVCRIEETGICDKHTWNLLCEYYMIRF